MFPTILSQITIGKYKVTPERTLMKELVSQVISLMPMEIGCKPSPIWVPPSLFHSEPLGIELIVGPELWTSVWPQIETI